MSGTWTIDDISGLIQLTVGLGAFGTLAYGYGVLRQQNSNQASEIVDLKARLDTTHGELNQFKERVAVDYVSRDLMRDLEERLVGAMDKVVDRLDKLADRLDRMFASKH